jgi:hypothetical protein
MKQPDDEHRLDHFDRNGSQHVEGELEVDIVLDPDPLDRTLRLQPFSLQVPQCVAEPTSRLPPRKQKRSRKIDVSAG